MPPPTRSPKLMFVLPPWMHRALQMMAAEEDRPVSRVIRQAVGEYLERRGYREDEK